MPPPVDTAEFRRAWEGLSMFDSPGRLVALGRARNWRLGEFIAEVNIPAEVNTPDEAPITYGGPDRKGHWLLYDANGNMLVEESATCLLDYVVRVLHGPSQAT